MKNSTRSVLFTVLIMATLGMPSCEQPELTESEETSSHPTQQQVSPQAVEAKPVAEKEEKAPEPKKEPAHPELEVYRENDTIVIKGAMKSRLQVARIVEEMTESFPSATIDNQLKVETHRFPVGWGNRITQEFLIGFFQSVKEPYVGYDEGIVTLKGEYPRGQLKTLQEGAITVFSGNYLKDVKNEMVEVQR